MYMTGVSIDDFGFIELHSRFDNIYIIGSTKMHTHPAYTITWFLSY